MEPVPEDGGTTETVERLVALAGDEPFDEEYQRPLGLLLDLWKQNPALCERVVLESVAYWEDFPLVVDDLQLAAHELDDPAFLGLLDRCSRAKRVPSAVRVCLLGQLIEHGHAEAIKRYQRSLRKFVSDLREGRSGARRENLTGRVMEACRLRVPGLLAHLEELQRLATQKNDVIVHVLDRVWIDAAVLWQREGAEALVAAVEDPRNREQEHRAACVFCLACERDPAHVDRFERWFETTDAWHGYRVQLACIEGIVYTAEPERSAAFLARAMAREPHGGLLSRLHLRFSACGTVGALLVAAYHAPLFTDELAAAVRRWLEYPRRDIAAEAHAVLRHHKAPAPDPNHRVRDQLKWTEKFLREHGSPYGLMSARPPRSGCHGG